MLENTFCHLRGIGPKTERRLWDAGVRSWRDVNDGAGIPSRHRAERLREGIRESAERLSSGDAAYFQDGLPSAEQWRMFPDFRDSVAYLDIETTGLGSPGDCITTIGMYDGRSMRHYTRGDNLHDFARDVAGYKLLVTYNGKSFDVPFIRNDLGLPMDQAHIDLRYVLGSLGLRGGLKGCERQLGIDRGDLADIDGFFAVLLWNDYRRNGNDKALETLLAYNTVDVVNLEVLMVAAYNLKLEDTPFLEDRRLPEPVVPETPFRADMDTLERIAREHYGVEEFL